MGRVSSDESLRKTFGRRLRAARKRHGMTQQQVADRAHVTLSYVFRLEKGERNPTLLIVHDLAGALGVRVRDLTDPD